VNDRLDDHLRRRDDAELLRLRNLERRVKAIVGYYTPEDLAAHIAAALDGGKTYSFDGVVRSVWVNHKLVESFRSLYVELFPERAKPPRT
jgi:hypothetical protein